MNNKSGTAFILMSVLLASCNSHHEAQTTSTIKVKEVSQDIRLPRNLFKELEKEIADEFKSITPVFAFIPLQVEFKDKDDQEVLKDSPIRFAFEKGGGQVDLKEVVDGTGTFYIYFPSEQFVEGMDLMHLYYISQAPQKKIEGEVFGLGCGKWIDIKSRFKQLQKPTFLKLNTTGLRHLHVLAGHYLFVFRQGNQVLLTQLSLTDSRFTTGLCDYAGDEE